MNIQMREHINLTEKIEKLQSSSLNCGGMWKVRIIEKEVFQEGLKDALIRIFQENPKFDQLEKHEEFQKREEWNPFEQTLTRNIKLIEISDWKKYLNERIDYWSEFELISKEEMMLDFRREIYENNKREFLQSLTQELYDESNNLKCFRLDDSTFDTYDLWWHQIQEDLVFDQKKSLIVLNFGWSS